MPWPGANVVQIGSITSITRTRYRSTKTGIAWISLSIPDGSQDAVIEAFEAYLAATKRGHFKHNQIASLLYGYKLNLRGRSPMMKRRPHPARLKLRLHPASIARDRAWRSLACHK